jgi:hypothetical protein
MIMIGPFAPAEAQYRQSRLVGHEVESYRRTRRSRRTRTQRRRLLWRALSTTTRVRPA